MRVKDESKAHSALKAKLKKEYRAYKDKARLDVKCRDLSSKLKEVLSDLKQPARTYDSTISQVKKYLKMKTRTRKRSYLRFLHCHRGRVIMS